MRFRALHYTGILFAFLLFIFAPCLLAQETAGATVAASTNNHIKTVWVINMENKNWTGDTLAHNVKGNPEAPFINNTLTRLGAHAVNYANLIHPSEPNKIWEEA